MYVLQMKLFAWYRTITALLVLLAIVSSVMLSCDATPPTP